MKSFLKLFTIAVLLISGSQSVAMDNLSEEAIKFICYMQKASNGYMTDSFIENSIERAKKLGILDKIFAMMPAKIVGLINDKAEFSYYLQAKKGQIFDNIDLGILYDRAIGLGMNKDTFLEFVKVNPASAPSTPQSPRSPNISTYEDAPLALLPTNAPVASSAAAPASVRSSSPTERLKIMSGHAGLAPEESQNLFAAFAPRQEAVSIPQYDSPYLLEAFAPRQEAVPMPGAAPQALEAFAPRQEAVPMPGASPQPFVSGKEIFVIVTVAAIAAAAIKGSAYYVYSKYQQIPAEERAKMNFFERSSRVACDIGNEANGLYKKAQDGISNGAEWTKKTVWPKRTA